MVSVPEAVAAGASARAVPELFAPPAVTLIGATPKSHVTEVLLANFTRADRRFPGPINLVNPGRNEVFGRPAVPDVDAIEGSLGLVYVLLDAARALDFLEGVQRSGAFERATGFVVYGAGFAEAGDVSAHARLVACAQRMGTPLLGPQSTGLVSASSGLLGITDPVPERFAAGRVGFVAQSTGLLGGALSWLFRRGIGVEKAVGFGNGAVLTAADLVTTLCFDPSIEVVCAYVDAIGSIDEIVAMGEASWRTGTPVVLYPGGRSTAAQEAARTHTGVLATGERAIIGCAEQCGVVLVDDFAGLLWGAELLTRADLRGLDHDGVGIFTASGGGGIIAADALEQSGVRLAQPSAATRTGLDLPTGGNANPYDIGAISLDRPEDYRDKVAVYARDDDLALVVKPESLGAPSQSLASHRRSLEAFVSGVTAAGKVPVIAYPFPEDPRDYSEAVQWPEVVVAGGGAELGGKLRLLQAYAARPRRDVWPQWYQRPEAASASDAVTVLWPAGETDALIGRLGICAPRCCTVNGSDGVESVWSALGPVRALVAKTAAPLPHRAKAGGVLLDLRSEPETRAAVELLTTRFDAPVLLSEQVSHVAAFFVGLQTRPDGRTLLAFGTGVATDDSNVVLRLCPLDPADARQLVDRTGGAGDPGQLADVLVRVSTAAASTPHLAVLDINPLVLTGDGRLVALDAKAYGTADTTER